MQEIYISETECALLMERLKMIRHGIGNVPKELVFDKNPPPISQVERFDANRFFEVFDKVRLNEGYVLDYVYFSAGFFGGRPLLYTRKIDSEPLSSVKDLKHIFVENPDYPFPSSMAWTDDVYFRNENHPYRKDIEFEKTPSGYFQFALFCIAVEQFYLYQHDAYKLVYFIITQSELEERLWKFHLPEKDQMTIRATDLRPTITQNNNSAGVKVAYFSPWRGYKYYSCNIKWPNIINDRRVEKIVHYDCGRKI